MVLAALSFRLSIDVATASAGTNMATLTYMHHAYDQYCYRQKSASNTTKDEKPKR